MSTSRAPNKSGTIQNQVLAPFGTVSASNPLLSNVGYSLLTQTGTMTQNSTTAVDLIFYIPALSQITGFNFDVLVAYDSATSATLSVGSATAGTQYVSGVDVKAAAGRIAPTYTAAQLTAMASTAATTQTANVNPYSKVFVTVTIVGATAAGNLRATMFYVQKD